jgi:hypothetical protein
VGSRNDLDDVEKGKILPLQEQKLRSVDRAASNESLYRLGYPGSAHAFLVTYLQTTKLAQDTRRQMRGQLMVWKDMVLPPFQVLSKLLS